MKAGAPGPITWTAPLGKICGALDEFDPANGSCVSPEPPPRNHTSASIRFRCSARSTASAFLRVAAGERKLTEEEPAFEVTSVGFVLHDLRVLVYVSLNSDSGTLWAHLQWRWIKLARTPTTPEQSGIRELPVWVAVVKMCSVTVFAVGFLSEFSCADLYSTVVSKVVYPGPCCGSRNST
jgi:hypothetical protein